jgi:hypothetical protein
MQMSLGSLRTVLGLSGLLAMSCSVGEVPTNGDGGATACADRITPASPGHTHKAGGGANTGMNCVSSGCHRPGAVGTDAPPYQFGGSVYAVGTQNPSAGATVRIRFGTKLVVAVTDAAGNFSFPAGSLTGTFNALVDVSACPGGTSMVGGLVSGGDPTDNNCNGCHAPGGTTTPIAL